MRMSALLVSFRPSASEGVRGREGIPNTVRPLLFFAASLLKRGVAGALKKRGGQNRHQDDG